MVVKINFSYLMSLITVLFILSSCGGSDDEEANDIDLSLFLFPESSRTVNYEEYSCNTTSANVCRLANVEQEEWVVNGNTLSLTGDEQLSVSIIIAAETIQVTGEDTEGQPYEYEFDRHVKAGENLLENEESELERTFLYQGPFSAREFVLGTQVFNESDVVIRLDAQWSTFNNEELEEPMTEDVLGVEMQFYVKGEGELGSLYFDDCDHSVEIDIDTDFSNFCETLDVKVIVE